MPILPIVAIICYLISIILIIPGLLKKNSLYKTLALLAAAVGIILHITTLHHSVFDGADGQNISLLNVASGSSLIISLIMTQTATRNRGWLVLPIVYGFAIINLALSSFMPWEVTAHLAGNPKLLSHIVLALFSYSTLMIAALYALQLMFIDHQLKYKTLKFTTDMPPLMVIERKLFHITLVGVVLLTLTLLTGLLYVDNFFAKENIHKAVFTILAWLVYIILLWGHYQKGWRGKRLIWCNFSAAVLLTIGYFGSRLVQYLAIH